MKNLKEKSIDGIVWSLIEKYGSQIFSLIIGVILARILTPQDYGLIGLVAVFPALAQVFMNSGFGAAYIQKKDSNQIDASSIFFFNLLVSILFYFLFWALAPYIASFYNQKELSNLIRVISFILVINSFSMMQVTILTKKVDFKKKTIINIVSIIMSGSIGVAMALKGYGVWSLVVQQLIGGLLRAIGLWSFYSWRPSIVISIKALRSMFKFGAWVLLSNLLKALFDNLNALVIGKYFPMSQLGFYNKAKNYQKTVSVQPTSAIGVVSFPVFSNLQGDKQALKNAMRKFSQNLILIITPVACLLIVISEPLVITLLTEKWREMIVYFDLMLIIGLLYPLNVLNIQMLLSQGFSSFNFRITLFKNFFRVLNTIIMYRYGVLYIVYGEIIIAFLELFINSYYAKRIMNYALLNQIVDVYKIYISGVLVVILGNYYLIFFEDDTLKIVAGIICSVLIFSISQMIYNRLVFLQIVGLLVSKLTNKKQK